MNSEQIQLVVDAENKRLNEQSLEKATVRLRDIQMINKRIEVLQAERAALQKEIADLKFDSVTAADVVGAGE